jgi:hypothetical protein
VSIVRPVYALWIGLASCFGGVPLPGFTGDGCNSGEANYAVRIEPGDSIVADDGRLHRVVDVVPVDEHSRFVGFLMVRQA